MERKILDKVQKRDRKYLSREAAKARGKVVGRSQKRKKEGRDRPTVSCAAQHCTTPPLPDSIFCLEHHKEIDPTYSLERVHNIITPVEIPREVRLRAARPPGLDEVDQLLQDAMVARALIKYDGHRIGQRVAKLNRPALYLIVAISPRLLHRTQDDLPNVLGRHIRATIKQAPEVALQFQLTVPDALHIAVWVEESSWVVIYWLLERCRDYWTKFTHLDVTVIDGFFTPEVKEMYRPAETQTIVDKLPMVGAITNKAT